MPLHWCSLGVDEAEPGEVLGFGVAAAESVREGDDDDSPQQSSQPVVRRLPRAPVKDSTADQSHQNDHRLLSISDAA
jgi:hypothetical protein